MAGFSEAGIAYMDKVSDQFQAYAQASNPNLEFDFTEDV